MRRPTEDMATIQSRQVLALWNVGRKAPRDTPDYHVLNPGGQVLVW
jgi:hypothetical protein